MSEAFECFLCRKIMVLFGGDPNRCPGCGSSHGKLLTKKHVDHQFIAGKRGARGRQSTKKKPASARRRKLG